MSTKAIFQSETLSFLLLFSSFPLKKNYFRQSKFFKLKSNKLITNKLRFVVDLICLINSTI